MFFLLAQGIECFATAACLLPIFLLLHSRIYRKTSHTLWCYLLALYFGGIYFLTGLPTVTFAVFDPTLYWIPFAGFFNDFRNSLLNIVLFVPFGFLLPLLSRELRDFRKMLTIGFLTSLAIELAQLFTYRVTDINDLINNTLGTALGYVLYIRYGPRCHIQTQLSSLEISTAGIASAATMFFLQQSLASYLFCLIF